MVCIEKNDCEGVVELRQLQTFRTVAQTLSFSRAAKKLNYAQSTVSAQIQALEEELNVTLFDRLGKRVDLTDAGKQLLSYAEQILGLVHEAQSTVSAGDAVTGSLIVSAPETLCAYRLPRVLLQFRQKFPEVQLTFILDPETDFYGPIHDGSVDVAFLMEEPFQSPYLVIESLIPEPLLIVTYPDHPLAHQKGIRFADLQKSTIIQTEAFCSYRRMFERSAVSAGVRLSAAMEFRSVEAIKQCVMAHLGLTILPEIAVRNEIKHGHLIALDWDGPPLEMATQMIYHKDKTLSPAMRAFLQLARQMLGSINPQ